MRSVLAADLGGTKCRVALVTESHGVVGAVRVATRRQRGEFLADLEQAAARVLAARPGDVLAPAAFGVGTAGVMPPGGRAVLHAPNLPLDGFALADHLERRLGLPAVLINDGRASALGEYRCGSARGLDPLVCLFFGTGIGIGVVADGRPYGGADNAAGEIGHTVFVPGGRRCACGAAGHFEAYCGGRAITERAHEELGAPPRDAGWTVTDVLADGRDAARAILRDAETAAAVLVANACTLWNPRAVVLGGGVLDGWPALRSHIEAQVRALCTAPITQHLQFHRSDLGSDAVLLGAAAATGALWQDQGTAR
jgi:glucokinase